MAHLLAFADHDDVQALFAKIGDTPDVPVDVNALLAMTTFDLGTLTHATRALWLLGRRPRLVLRDVKNLSGDVRRQMRVLRELGLGVIALSSTKLRAEATKALSRGRGAASSSGLKAPEIAFRGKEPCQVTLFFRFELTADIFGAVFRDRRCSGGPAPPFLATGAVPEDPRVQTRGR